MNPLYQPLSPETAPHLRWELHQHLNRTLPNHPPEIRTWLMGAALWWCPPHPRRAAIEARGVLWRDGRYAPSDREIICGLIRYQALPLNWPQMNQPRRDLLRATLTISSHLILLFGQTLQELSPSPVSDPHTALNLWPEWCEESGINSSGHFDFASDEARIRWFEDPTSDPHYAPHPVHPPPPEVIVMSGLPASGKDTFLKTHCPGIPVISLDQLRQEMQIEPDKTPGELIQIALKQARGVLRQKRPFAWNSTGLNPLIRQKITQLARDYGATLHMVCTEVDPHTLYTRNAHRPARVPAGVILKMLGRWEPPDRSEAHRITIC